ncbi:Modification methylase DpnIIB [Aminobacter sp. MSH1]|uniref:DNA-methyltransferase n=1 Tax=Aminobacter sp. MSH1 TaxID=374606 RepID=UPI000D3A928F|nr:site-specific DNA-methyltransferase [Aminobacter sp. MSH1]AWC25384.1 Modification methylase DpnIIB [Aminobacter sp. MSH1]
MTYDPTDDARKSYDAAIEAKRLRGDTHDWEGRSPIKREVVIGDCRLILGDCLPVMRQLPNVAAVLTDPPYGIGMDGGNVGYKGFNDFEKKGWDKSPPSEETIKEITKIGARYIIWGGNYFGLPPARCYLVWDKGAGFKGRSYAESELAMTNMDSNARTFSYDPLARGDYKGKLHPTQKPVQLMKWCIGFLPADGTILDPFMGSGSTGVACAALGRAFIGIEIDEGYFDIACERIRKAYAQPDMFVEVRAPEPKQEAML